MSRDVPLHMASLEEIAGELHRRASRGQPAAGRRSCNHCLGTGQDPVRRGVHCQVCDGTGLRQPASLFDIFETVKELAGGRDSAGPGGMI